MSKYDLLPVEVPVETTEPIKTDFTFNDLEGEWGEPSKEATFSLIDPKGVEREFTVKIIQDMEEQKRTSEMFKGAVTILTAKSSIPAFAEYCPMSKATAEKAVMLHTLIVKPELTLAGAAKLVRKRAVFANALIAKIVELTAPAQVSTELALIEAEKND